MVPGSVDPTVREELDDLREHDRQVLEFLSQDPASLVGFQALHVEVESEGRVARGLSLADRRPIPMESRLPANCRVALSVDAPRFLTLFLERLCRASA